MSADTLYLQHCLTDALEYYFQEHPEDTTAFFAADGKAMQVVVAEDKGFLRFTISCERIATFDPTVPLA